MQVDEIIVTQPEQARALQDSGFLSRFLEPASPSDVARELGIPANLAHHHAKRHASLGLLREVDRQRGKVYYQLAARRFKHDRSLLPPGDPDEHTAVMLRQLATRFLAAQERSDRLEAGEDPSWHIYGFDRNVPEGQPTAAPVDAGRSMPAHFQARTLRLRPRRYRDLVRHISRAIREAEADEEPDGELCTLVFVAFDGLLQEGSRDSQFISSFVPASEPGDDQSPLNEQER